MRTPKKSLVLTVLASSLLIVACSSSDGSEGNENPSTGGSSSAGKGGSSAGGSSAGGSNAGGKAGSSTGGSNAGGKAGSNNGGASSGGTDAGGTNAGGTDAGGTDAGGTDAGGTDAGGTDAGGTDAGGTDAGGTDAGGTDAGGTDAGGTDAGGTDAGGTDAGGTDAGGTDAGGTDAGGTDAGGTDAGGTDAGGSDAGGAGGSSGISDACLNCIGANCDAEFNTCAGDPACLACATGDPTTAECLSNANLLAAVACACQPTTCAATDCANECTLFGGGQGGSGAGGDAGAGGTDAGGSDAGGTDAGGTDAGGTDAGGTDAGGTNAGGTDAGGTSSGGTDAGGTDAGGAGGSEAAGSGGSGQAGDTGSGGSAGACVTQSAEATLVKKPVDIIFVIDNSGSMSNEIKGVQDNINKNFAQIIEASGLDYRVIMVSRHGNYSSVQSICIASPLSGTTCSPIPTQPANTSNFFHFSIEIASTDSLRKIIETFSVKDEFNLAPNGWSKWLRSDAFKIFVEVTDDNQNPNSPQSGAYTAAAFETKLFALPGNQFGTAQQRNYIFHSIIGMPTKGNDPAAAYLPTDPKVTGTSKPSQVCSTAVNSGPTYQDLSILTGGLRFPICNTASYDAVFKKIAEGVIEGSKVACDFAIPDPSIIDPATVKIEYTPGNGGAVKTYLQVPDVNACAPGKIYISNDIVHMCPDTCTEVQADNKAKLNVLYGCKIFL